MYRINLKLSFLFCLVQFFSDFPELPFRSKADIYPLQNQVSKVGHT